MGVKRVVFKSGLFRQKSSKQRYNAKLPPEI